jgi:hypothetical protein
MRPFDRMDSYELVQVYLCVGYRFHTRIGWDSADVLVENTFAIPVSFAPYAPFQ